MKKLLVFVVLLAAGAGAAYHFGYEVEALVVTSGARLRPCSSRRTRTVAVAVGESMASLTVASSRKSLPSREERFSQVAPRSTRTRVKVP